MNILIPIGILFGIAILCAVMLTVSNAFFGIKEDEKTVAIRDCLPGANCGACGYSGCDGYAKALTEFDSWLPKLMEQMGEEDVVMITADHGCDPAYTATTDHTREYVPLIVAGPKVKPVNLGTRVGFCDIAATVAELLDVELETEGVSFAGAIMQNA